MLHAIMICRICFEGDDEYPLFEPCICAGSVAHIHEHCLFRWVDTKGQKFPKCELCKSRYRIIYNRPIEEIDKLTLVRGYFLVYPSWHTLASCILQIILTKLRPWNSMEVNYVFAQLLYQFAYTLINAALLYRSLRSPMIYLQYAVTEPVVAAILIHVIIWSQVFMTHRSHPNYFMLISTANQCWLGLYPMIHHTIVKQMNQDRRRVLI